MILIADSGATKTDWRLLRSGIEPYSFITQGINPYFASSEVIANILDQEIPVEIKSEFIDQVCFYGAGCSLVNRQSIVNEGIKSVFAYADVLVASDLMAAARALSGDDSGLVAILGTGSNIGYYNGHTITETVRSLGFILGDEGSGAYIGKRFLADYLQKRMPAELSKQFEQLFPMTYDQFLEGVYKSVFPSRFLGSFSLFASARMADVYIQDVIVEAFDQFFIKMVMSLTHIPVKKIGFVGSIAYTFAEQLTLTAQKFGYQISSIIPNPIDKLAAYHSKNL